MRLLLDLLLPCSCVACGADRGPVCRVCSAHPWQPSRRDPTPRPDGLPPVWAAAPFAGAARGLVLAYKQDACWPALRPLAAALAATVMAATGGAQSVLLVPVPSSAAARRRRGHQHVQALTRRACRDPVLRSAGVSCAALLVPRRATQDQRGLPAHERRSNLAGSMGARPVPPRLAGRPCVVIDDVVTTGSTALEATRALRAAGLPVLAVVAVAATRRRPRDRFAQDLDSSGDEG